jgi:hypothetical protein
MYKKDEKKITPVASTSVDPNLRAILDMMQHQNEEYQAAVNNLYKLIREEGAQGIKEIELIGKTMTEFELGDTSEFNSIITDDTNTSSRSTTQNTRITKHPVKRVRNEQTPEACDPTNYEDADKERGSYERSMFDAKTSIEFIPVLNGQDDIGVVGLIKRVREAGSECKEKRALLRLILTKRYVGEVERSIRHSVIAAYGDLFETQRIRIN